MKELIELLEMEELGMFRWKEQLRKYCQDRQAREEKWERKQREASQAATSEKEIVEACTEQQGAVTAEGKRKECVIC